MTFAMNNHYGFFNSDSNNISGSVQGAYLVSSTSSGAGTRPKGPGLYIHQSNFRIAIALYCVRTIPKHNWINSNNVYIGRR
jgi:hypothetical protein